MHACMHAYIHYITYIQAYTQPTLHTNNMLKCLRRVHGCLFHTEMLCTFYGKKKVKLSCYTPWRHMEERRYSSYSYLTSALDGGEWSASRSVRFMVSTVNSSYGTRKFITMNVNSEFYLEPVQSSSYFHSLFI
jgi:hypothetical protein